MDRLRDKEGNLRQMRAELTVATSESATLRLRAKKVVEGLSNIQVDVSLQTILQEDAREQWEAEVAVLEEV